jgi:hypothetical protein
MGPRMTRQLDVQDNLRDLKLRDMGKTGKILLRIMVLTIDGVRIGEWIY